jgi:hypothetical protein
LFHFLGLTRSVLAYFLFVLVVMSLSAAVAVVVEALVHAVPQRREELAMWIAPFVNAGLFVGMIAGCAGGILLFALPQRSRRR